MEAHKTLIDTRNGFVAQTMDTSANATAVKSKSTRCVTRFPPTRGFQRLLVTVMCLLGPGLSEAVGMDQNQYPVPRRYVLLTH